MNKEVKIYVGIDFSKEKFNACLLTQAGVMGEGEFPNTKSGYQNLLKWTKKIRPIGRKRQEFHTRQANRRRHWSIRQVGGGPGGSGLYGKETQWRHVFFV